MRPLDSKKFKRSMTALTTGLLVSAALVTPAAAQSAPTTPVQPAPTKPPTVAAKPAEPTTPKTSEAKATATAQPATRADATKPETSKVAPAKPADTKAALTSTTATEKPKAVDKKAVAGAKKAYGDATAAFKAGKYDQALVKFQEAESLVPSANAEYWIAVSLDKLDRQVEALAAYATFLANPEVNKAGEDKVSESKARFDALRATVPGEVILTAVPADAKLSVDGQAQVEKSPWTLKLTPGDHKILVTADGYVPQEVTVNVEAAKRTSRTLELAAVPPPPPPEPIAAPPAPPPAPPPPPPPPARSLVPAYVTLGIAAVAAGAGTYFGIRALSAKSDYDDKPTASKADDVENNALIADMAFGVAITLGVTGIVLLTTPEEQSATPATAFVKPKRISLSPWASPKSGGASALIEF